MKDKLHMEFDENLESLESLESLEKLKNLEHEILIRQEEMKKIQKSLKKRMVFQFVIVIIVAILNVSIVFISLTEEERSNMLIAIAISLTILSAYYLIAYKRTSLIKYNRAILLMALATAVAFIYVLSPPALNVLASIVGVASFLYLIIEKVVEAR